MIVSPTADNINKAAKLLRDGGIVGLPTETVYGLGADATNDDGCKKIFTLKQRPQTNPLIVHCGSVQQIREYTNIPLQLKTLFEKAASFWPGPLTIILPSAGKVVGAVTAGLSTIGVRIPNHPVALSLINALGKPIAAPSANKSMSISPTSAEHVFTQFGSDISLILDGGQCQVGLESTIIELAEDGARILRPGAITAEQLAAATEVKISYANKGHTPGNFAKHYAPNTPAVLLSKISLSAIPAGAILLKFTPLPNEITSKFAHVISLTDSGTLDEAAQRLYSSMYTADAAKPPLMVIEDCTAGGIGYALVDRINKATGHE